KGESLTCLNSSRQSPLHIAAQYQKPEVALAILEQLTSKHAVLLLNHVDGHGKTPLGYACLHGNEPLVCAFLKCGADVKQIINHSHGNYALHESAFYGHAGIIPMLLAAGAAPSLTNQNKQTAFTIGLLQNARWSLALLAAQYPVNWLVAEQSGSVTLQQAVIEAKQVLLTHDYQANTVKLDKLRRQAEAEDCLPLQCFCLAQQAILELDKGSELAKMSPKLITDSRALKKQHQAYQHYLKAALYFNGASSYYNLQSTNKEILANFLPPDYDIYLLNHLYVVEACMLQELFQRGYHRANNDILAHRQSLSAHKKYVGLLLEDEVSAQQILLENTRRAEALLIQLAHETIEVLGRPPCEYAVKFVGSWERKEMTLCSDVEWFILIEQETPSNLAYFRKFSQLVQLKFINLGQTPLPIQTQSSNPLLKKAIQAKALSPLPQGFRADEAYITPLGNPEWPFELIGTPATLLKFQEERWAEHAPELQYALRAITPQLTYSNDNILISANGHSLLETYQQQLYTLLNAKTDDRRHNLRHQRALALLAQHIYEDYPLRLTTIAEGRTLNVKNDLYRPLSMLVSDLALYFGISKTNTWECIHELQIKKYISESIARDLQRAFSTCVRFRLLAQLHYGTEHEMLWHPQTPEQDYLPPYLVESKPPLVLTEQHLEELVGVYQILLPLYRLAQQFIQTQGQHNGFAMCQLDQSDPIAQHLAQGLMLETVGNYSAAYETYLAGLGIKRVPELLVRAAICAAEKCKHDQQALPEHRTYFAEIILPLLEKSSKENPAANFLPYYRSLPGFLRDEFRQLLLQYEPEYAQVPEILRALNQYPEKTGKRPAVAKAEQRWRNKLQALGYESSENNESTEEKPVVILESPLLGRRYLKPELIEKLFDEQLNFRSNKINASQHDVILVEQEDDKLYLKKDPEMVGMTYLIEHIHQRTIGHGTSHGELAKLVVGKKEIPVLISEAISGENFHDVIVNSPEKLQHLDHQSMCELILIALLTNPEDGKASNYIFQPLGEIDRYTLVSVDHDHAMFPAFTSKSGLLGMQDTLHIKTILYCLDNMQKVIAPNARQAFLEIDATALLRSLLLEAQQKNQHYKQLFSAKTMLELHKNNKRGSTTIPIPLKQGDAILLQQRLIYLQQLLTDNPHLTPMQLLQNLEPRVGQIYLQAYKQHNCPNKRFEAAVGRYYQQAANGHIMTSTAAVSSLRIQQSVFLQDKYLKLSDLDPAQGLAELDKLIYEQSILSDVRKKLQQGDAESFKTLLTPSHKELVINGHANERGIDFKAMVTLTGKPDIAIQLKVLLSIIDYAPYRRLKLRYCSALNRQTLVKLLKRVPDIIELDLSYCSFLNDGDINTIARLCPTLRKLQLQGCHKLQAIQANFPALEYLVINQCRRLATVDIQATHLQVIKTKACVQLKAVKTLSLSLTVADLRQCKQLTDIAHLTQNFKLLQEWSLEDSKPSTKAWLELILACNNRTADIVNLADYNFNREQDINVLETMLQNAVALTELTLGNKKYTPEEVESLLKTLLDKKGLQKLNLARCILNQASMRILATLINNNPGLDELDLSRCAITPELFQLIEATLTKHQAITVLNLENNTLGDKGAQAVAKILLSQVSIRHLDLSYNEIANEGITAFAKVIAINKRLIGLNFTGNQISRGLTTIIASLERNTCLLNFDIAYNPEITDKQQKELAKLLQRNKDLANNAIDGPVDPLFYKPLFQKPANIDIAPTEEKADEEFSSESAVLRL
ncbi:MAG: hypothetical protein K0S11_938, partial [Gammaproteobacteria bacterium]|nr:hypothetical protein [Gammaproteobacteria bacterium]